LLGAFDLGLFQLRRDRAYNVRSDVVLQIENVFKSALEAVRPQVLSVQTRDFAGIAAHQIA